MDTIPDSPLGEAARVPGAYDPGLLYAGERAPQPGYDRRKIMIAADVLRAILVMLIPFLVPLNVFWLYVIVMLVSAIGQFFDPAPESILPEVATEEELAAANSMIAISSFGSTAVGFAAAGLIASAASLDWAFYANALPSCFPRFVSS